ncbi:MAG: bifunctional 2-keto-4-hydroxyglutarate aldolase/2-keto-3-deoxy-6-phosphogluconate aldolase [Clostridia bacterium]
MKEQILKKLMDAGLVAVVRAESAAQAVLTSKACIAGGVKVIEVTFTVPRAEEAIATLAGAYQGTEILIGAGTVCDRETAAKAVASGAQFVVGPYLSEAVAAECNAHGIPYLPGAMTLTEAVKCIEAGADIVKIFPGELFGPAIIKAFRGPMPQLQLMPTGGVSVENVHEWIAAGAVAVGVGSNLTAPAKTGDYDAVTRIAREYVEKIRDARAK